MNINIPFTKEYLSGVEIDCISQLLNTNPETNKVNWDQKCSNLLNKELETNNYFLTSSCTSSLEIAALLSKINHGDEFILPSYTFSSSANAFALRGGVPVFVDVREDTLNIDENKIESAISKKTKAIIVVHYAGVTCEMEKILSIANKYNLIVIEDAAQALGSSYKNLIPGTMGDFGAISLHNTKNIQCGEGGIFVYKNHSHKISAGNIIEKGTNRKEFVEGIVNKYEWQSLGSSYVLSDLQKAFLYGQLKNIKNISKRRRNICEKYDNGFFDLEIEGLIKRCKVPLECKSNGHIYFILLSKSLNRERIIQALRKIKISATSHYEPLHLSPAGKKFGKISGDLSTTNFISKKVLRLPVWPDLEDDQINFIIDSTIKIIRNKSIN